MVIEENRKAYSEIYNLFKIMNKNEVMKIPIEILEKIKEKRDKEYNPDIISKSSKVILSRKAICMYIYLYITYIEQEEQRIQETLEALKANEIRKYNEVKFYKDIFADERNEENTKVDLILYRENIFKKIINKIKAFWKGNKK